MGPKPSLLIRDLLNKNFLHIIINKKERACLELFSQKQISFSRWCHELQKKNWAQACWRFSDEKKLPNAKCWLFVTLFMQLLYFVFLPLLFDFTNCLNTRLALYYGKGISLMLSFLLMWSNWCKYTKSTITINKILIY